jgi:hypothetical protein
MSLKELLERVEKTISADRELDADITAHLNGWTKSTTSVFIEGKLSTKRQEIWSDKDGNCWLPHRGPGIPPLTFSLDAALALVEEKIRGFHGWARNLDGRITVYGSLVAGVSPSKLPTDALTMLSALLRALIAQEETTDV